MSAVSAKFKCFGDFKDRGATLLLVLVILADLVFIGIFLLKYGILFFDKSLSQAGVDGTFPLRFIGSNLFNIGKDGGYSEVFQYIKFFWIAVLFTYISAKRHSFYYCGWGLLFTYFLLDDSLEIHEILGGYIAGRLLFTPPLGLKLQDVGELVVSAVAGIVLFAPLVWFYIKGSEVFKKISRDMLLLVIVLVFFGVGVDTLHSALLSGRDTAFMVGAIEDGGEMITVSIMLWYVFFQSLRADKDSVYICDCIGRLLARGAASS